MPTETETTTLEETTQETPNTESTTEETTSEETTTEEKTPLIKGETKEEAPEPITLEALTLGEGIEITDDVGTEFLGLLNNNELSRTELAQGLLGLQEKLVNSAAEEAAKSMDDLRTEWTEESTKDPTLGGDKLEATLGSINKHLGGYEGQEKLTQLLAVSGLSNNIEMIRYMHWVSEQLNEPGFVSGENSPAPASREDALYTNTA